MAGSFTAKSNKNQFLDMSIKIILILLSFLIAFGFTVMTMPGLVAFCKKKHFYDQPNARKVHQNAVPRLGGSLFVPAILLALVFSLLGYYYWVDRTLTFKLSTWVLGAGMIFMYLVGIVDDLVGVGASKKFLVQIVASAFMPLCGLYINNLYGFMGIYALPLWFAFPFTILVTLLIVNSINLIDGIDGLASGIGLIALTGFSMMFWHSGTPLYSLFSAALLGTLLAFFLYNMLGIKSQYKIFMGDTGSLIVGYSLAYLSIKYEMFNLTVIPYRPHAMMVSFSLLFLPVMDLIRVALERLIHHKKIFTADKTHIHHLVLQAGASMHQALGVLLLFYISFLVINLYLVEHDILTSTWIVLLDVILYYIFIFVVRRLRKAEA